MLAALLAVPLLAQNEPAAPAVPTGVPDAPAPPQGGVQNTF
jgi:hypothetical protein